MLAGSFADGVFGGRGQKKVETFSTRFWHFYEVKVAKKLSRLVRAGFALRAGRANPSELKHKNREGQVTDFGKGLPSEAARFAAP